MLGIKSVDVKITTAATLFCGANGSGKSSIQECVRMAITQDHVRQITLKKDALALVHEGFKAGGAVVTIDDDADKSFAFNMPDFKFVGPEITEPMRVALHGQRFASMKPDERRTFLFGLTKLKPTAEGVKARMMHKKWACDESKVDAVLPLLRTGFPSVCDHAKSKATEAKGAWRILTGETYGAVKAQTWEAPVPEAVDGDTAALLSKVSALDKNIAMQNEALGARKAQQRAANENAARRESLAAAAAKVPSLVDQITRANADLAEYEPKVVALRVRAAGKARVGLVHDMAIYINAIYENSTEDEDEAFELMKRYQSEHGPLADAAKVDTEAQTALPEHEKGLLVIQSRIKNLNRDLDAAKQAKGQFDALAPDVAAVDASAEITAIEGMIATAKADRVKTENLRLDIEAANRTRAASAQKTADAMKSHADVLAWSQVAAALAPDGIPAEMLKDALAPVNEALAQSATDTDWMPVKIGDDMAITAAGRPYQMLSESEQWRTDAMIAQAVSEISGLKILMLDRVDVLDLPGRGQLLGWVDALADIGVIDTALLFATLKALPAGLPDTITPHWVEGGEIVEWEKSKAYAATLAANIEHRAAA
ncbi:MAG: hypothetical protein V4857_14190 [Pseudomonadota bacterium]